MNTTPQWPYTDRLDLEGRPTPRQQERLHDFLVQLRLLSAQYGLLIDSYAEPGESPVVRDLETGTVVGLQLSYFVTLEDPTVVTGYDFNGASILDGTWPVDGPNGTVQLRELDGRAERLRRQQKQ